MWTLVQQIDNILIAYYKTSADVAVYDGAFLLARLLIIVLSTFGFLFMPIFSELDKSDEIGRMQSVYRSVTEWAVLLVLPLYIALVLNPETILTVIFGADYSLGAVPLVIISTGFFVHVLSGLSGDALVALGHTRAVMIGNIGIGIINGILNIVLIPELGISGAAVASAISYAVFNLGYLYWLYKDTKIVPFSRHFLIPVGASSISLVSTWVLADTLIELRLILLILVGIFTYIIHAILIIYTKKFTIGDKEILSKIATYWPDN